jgi:Na+-driven multidrug efflux pump
MQGVNIALNRFQGVALNATMGVANQISNGINQFTQSFQVAFQPQIVKSYAAHNQEFFSSLLVRSSKFSFLLMLLIAVPLGLNIEFILKLWLGTVPPDTTAMAQLFLVFALLNTPLNPLGAGIQATGNIRGMQIANVVLFALFFAGASLFLWLGYAPTVVPAMQIVCSVLRSVAYLYFLRRQAQFSLALYAREVLLREWLVACISFPLAFWISRAYEGAWSVLASIGAFLLCYGASALWIGLTANERKQVLRKMAKKVN